MSQDLIRLMQALFLPSLRFCGGGWCPAADVYRTRTGWLVKFELAGVRPEDLRLVAAGRVLTLTGCRRDDCQEPGARQHHLEIDYGRFERSLELPFDLDRCRISTDYRDGLLRVHIEPEAER